MDISWFRNAYCTLPGQLEAYTLKAFFVKANSIESTKRVTNAVSGTSSSSVPALSRSLQKRTQDLLADSAFHGYKAF